MNQPNHEVKNLPPGLSAIAGNRDLITTPEVAQVFNVASQTIRKNYSLTGEAYGIRPTKIGNRLLWSVAQIAEKLKGAI
jgi:transcription initiation factor TFIIIB Brf1 subunit/transcription initiation factor TFIIB